MHIYMYIYIHINSRSLNEINSQSVINTSRLSVLKTIRLSVRHPLDTSRDITSKHHEALLPVICNCPDLEINVCGEHMLPGW